MSEMTITVDELILMFAGRRVRIITERLTTKRVEGICKTVHVTQEGFDIELVDFNRYGIRPENVTARSVEGPLRGSDRRKVELV